MVLSLRLGRVSAGSVEGENYICEAGVRDTSVVLVLSEYYLSVVLVLSEYSLSMVLVLSEFCLFYLSVVLVLLVLGRVSAGSVEEENCVYVAGVHDTSVW